MNNLSKAPYQDLKAVGVSVETMPALFFDENALREVEYTLYRLDSSGLRFYYTLDNNFNPTFYVSVTSKNDVVIPKGYGFHKWLSMNTEEESEYIKESRTCYGNLIHRELPKVLLDRTYDLDAVPELVEHHAVTHGFASLSGSWTQEFYKEILSFATFVKERNVVPIAVELMLKSDQYGYAGSLDLVCEMDFNRGRKVAVVDYKSSKKGNFYENHEVQLKDYVRMWNENFPDKKATHCFNYSGTDWRKKPSYKLQNQTDACSDRKADQYIELFKEKQEGDNLKPKDVLSVGGVLNLDEDFEGLYSVQSAHDFIRAKNQAEVV